jgi:hypothetical protein
MRLVTKKVRRKSFSVCGFGLGTEWILKYRRREDSNRFPIFEVGLLHGLLLRSVPLPKVP